jgi:membrane protein DedA with SNARE-associated domain
MLEESFSRFLEVLESGHPLWIYSFLAASAFLENVVPPVPGDTVVVFSAYLVGRGILGWWAVWVSTYLGGMAGFMLMYYLGLKRGRAFFAVRGRRLFSPEIMIKAEVWLARYGSWLVVANRFLTGIRSVIAISAGLGKMGWKRVAVLGSISMALWNGILLYIGRLVGQNWGAVSVYLKQYNQFIILMLVVLAGGYLLWRWYRHGS